MIVFWVYIVSIGCVFVADRYREKQILLANFLISCAVISLSSLNWLRDYSIGTDIEIYGNYLFQAASDSNHFSNYMQICLQSNMGEHGYAILNYIVSRFTDNPHLFYFIHGLLVNSLFLLACRLASARVNLTIMWTAYLFLLYPTTLNLLRQSVALALIMLMVFFAFQNRYVLSLVMLIFAYTFHHSSVLGILLLLFAFALNKSKSASMQNYICVLFSIGCIFLPYIIQRLFLWGIFDDKYEQYMIENSGSDIGSSLLIRLPFIFLSLYFFFKDNKQNSSSEKFYYTIVIAESILIPLRLISQTVFRLVLYFSVFKIPAYGILCKKISLPKSITYTFYILFLILYFYIQTIVGGANEFWPFVVADDIFTGL